MNTVYLKHFEIEQILISINDIITNEDNIKGINALTLHKLNKIAKDFQKEFEDYRNLKNNLLDKHVKGGSKKPEIKANSYVFKSDEDKEDFLDSLDEYVGVPVRTLLSEKDLSEFKADFRSLIHLEKVVEGEARLKDPTPKETEKEIEEAEIEEVE